MKEQLELVFFAVLLCLGLFLCNRKEENTFDYEDAIHKVQEARNGFYKRDSCILAVVDSIRVHLDSTNVAKHDSIVEFLDDIEYSWMDEDYYGAYGSLDDLEDELFSAAY